LGVAPRLSLIAAMTHSGVIGRGGMLPWKLSADLRRFKALTMGHTIIMGRKTFDSLGRVLPGRTMIVVTRQAASQLPVEVVVAHSLDEAIHMAASDSEAFVIGGGELFQQALPRADRIYVTWVEASIDGDTRFPDWDPLAWWLIDCEPHAADSKNEYDTTFCIYDRI
jgi:dihydrofolate reductase